MYFIKTKSHIYNCIQFGIYFYYGYVEIDFYHSIWHHHNETIHTKIEEIILYIYMKNQNQFKLYDLSRNYFQ